MAKRVIQLYDKYKSTTKVYPLIVGESLTPDAINKVKEVSGVPSITIEAEQMTSLTEAQLTDEQYDILNNNISVYATLPQGFSIMIDKLATDENVIWFSSNANVPADPDIDVHNFLINVNKNNKKISLVEADAGGGKQLYQHNIAIYFNNTDTGSRTYLNLSIILDNNTALDTTEKVANKLWDLGLDLYNDKGMVATGFHFSGGSINKTNVICRVGAYNNYPYHKRVRFQYFDATSTTAQTVGYNDLLPTEGSVVDIIVAL